MRSTTGAGRVSASTARSGGQAGRELVVGQQPQAGVGPPADLVAVGGQAGRAHLVDRPQRLDPEPSTGEGVRHPLDGRQPAGGGQGRPHAGEEPLVQGDRAHPSGKGLPTRTSPPGAAPAAARRPRRPGRRDGGRPWRPRPRRRCRRRAGAAPPPRPPRQRRGAGGPWRPGRAFRPTARRRTPRPRTSRRWRPRTARSRRQGRAPATGAPLSGQPGPDRLPPGFHPLRRQDPALDVVGRHPVVTCPRPTGRARPCCSAPGPDRSRSGRPRR